MCSITGSSQSEVNLSWKNQFGDPDLIPWSSSIILSDGSVLLTGNAQVQNQGANIYVAKYDRNGEFVWHNSYNHSYNGNDYGASLAVDSDGNILVTGASETSASNGLDLAVLKLNSTGSLQWAYYFNYSGSADDAGSAMVVDDEDNIYVTGVGTSVNNDADYITIKLTSNGDTVWTSSYNYNNLPDIALDIKLAADEILVTGASSDNITKWDIATVKMNNSMGDTISTRREPGSQVGYDRPTGFIKDNSGNFYITGTALNAQSKYVIRTIKLDTALNLIWSTDIDGHGNDNESAGIFVDQNHEVYITGSSKTGNNKWEWISAKIDTAGTVDWYHYQTSLDGGDAQGKAICVDFNGTVFVSGNIQNNEYYNIVTAQYKNDGTFGWQKVYEVGANEDEYPLKIELRNNSKVVVTGYSDGNNRDYILLMYESFDKEYVYEFDDDTIPVFVKNQINVKIDTSFIKTSTIDNRDITFGEMSDFLTNHAIDTISKYFPQDYNIDQMKIIKIHKWLKTSTTESIARNGDTIPIPVHWNEFTMHIPESWDYQDVLDTMHYLGHIFTIAESNNISRLFTTASDPQYSNQHSLFSSTYTNAHINIEDAWTYVTGRYNMKVGIFDSGVDADHADFQYDSYNQSCSRVPDGYDYVNNNSNASDVLGHGTGVAGIIGAKRNNQSSSSNYVGIAGIAGGDITQDSYSGVRMYSMQVGDFQHFCEWVGNGWESWDKFLIYDDDVAEAFLEGGLSTPDGGWGLHVFNCSFGDYQPSSIVEDNLETVWRNGVTVVCAKGNDNINNDTYPADYADHLSLAVGGSGVDGERWEDLSDPSNPIGSNYGHFIDLIAPASENLIKTTEVVTSLGNNNYGSFNATSGAAPHVTGVVCLIQSYAMDYWYVNDLVYTPEDIEKILDYSCVDILPLGPDVETGAGRLDAGNAIAHIRPPYYLYHYGKTVTMPDPTNIQNDPNAVYLGLETTQLSTLAFDYVEREYWSYTFTINHPDYPGKTEFDRWLNISASDWPVNNHDITNATQSSFDVTVYYSRYTYHFNTGGTMVFHIPSSGGSYIFKYTLYEIEDVLIEENNPDRAWLGQVYPNPATTQIVIPFKIPRYGKVKLCVTNLLGADIILISDDYKEKGNYTKKVDIKLLKPGLYFYKLEHNEDVFTKKLLVLDN